MANDSTKLITNAKRYTQPNGISDREQLCLLAIMWTKALYGLGGPGSQGNYTFGTGANALDLKVSDWNSIFPAMGSNIMSMTEDQVTAGEINVIAVQGGNDSASMGVLRLQAGYLLQIDPLLLRKAILFMQSAFMEYVKANL